MGVDVESKLAHVSVEAGSENGGLKENGTVPNEPIKFGSHGTEEPVKEDVKKAPAINLPKDAVVEDWPAPQQIHSFYLVKYRTFEDQMLKAKLEQAEKELHKKNQARSQMIDNLRAKRAARSELINERKSLSAERQQFRSQIDEKRKVMEPLQQALGKLRGNNGFGRDRGSIIFSSETELNDYIKSLQYRIQHESITLNEEKQILREIKQIEGTREKVIANAAERAKIQESLGEKESIQSQVKLIGVDLDGVRKEQQVLSAKLKEIDDELDAMKKEIGTLEEELTALTQQRDKTFQSIQEFRKQREEGNSSFFQSRKLNLEARQLADKKDVAALRELSETEVDKFVTQWSSNKSFRDDYEKRILQSLDMRQLSKDGRMRNPDEKPLVLPETPNVPAPEVVVKTTQKASKEDSVPPPQPDASLASKAQKDKNSKQQKDGKKKPSKSSLEVNDLDDDEEIPGVTNLPKDSTPKRVVVDEEMLKQMRREEEIAKNKQAIERKKKLAEKAADRERKAKKKAGVAGTDEPTEDPSEKTSKDAEPEKPEENVEAADEPMKPTTKDRKVGPLRQRPRGAKGSDIHKVILKRKKSTNYWIWAAPAAAVVILLLLAVGYKFYA
nr:proton pump-interactor 1-like [Ipomoea batatas]GMD90181.1 proton pump-interactor 1-like [Ipomoea batatas]